MADKIRCLIVDDEEMSRKMLEALVKRVNSLSLIKSCENAFQALETLKHEEIDLVFLDVEMPDLNGLEFLNTLKSYPEIIICSAQEKYALKAFEHEVADFLLKPVTLERFLKAVSRIENRFSNDSQNYANNESVFVKANNQIVSVRLKDITWVEAYGDYVNIFTEKDRLVVHATMKGIESRLPSNQFIRVHRSFIVRLDKINAIEDTLIVIGKKLIPIGDSYRNELMKKLNFL